MILLEMEKGEQGTELGVKVVMVTIVYYVCIVCVCRFDDLQGL